MLRKIISLFKLGTLFNGELTADPERINLKIESKSVNDFGAK